MKCGTFPVELKIKLGKDVGHWNDDSWFQDNLFVILSDRN